MPKPPQPPASLEYNRMLFLVGHGLQSPLSAIRWGCGRLKRTGDNLTKEQKKILGNVVMETRTLSHMIDWLLLLAKVEEGIHVPDIQEIFVEDLLSSTALRENLPRALDLSIDAPRDLKIRIDRRIFESILGALLLTVATGSDASTVEIRATLEKKTNRCVIEIIAPLTLSLLQERVHSSAVTRRVVGGVPGFLLSAASSLARMLEGTLESHGEAQDVDRLTLSMPLTPRIPPLQL